MGTQAEPIDRPGSRVIPVDRAGRVLLLQGRDPARPERLYWFTIGGGTEPGDTAVTTATRELAEETGIVVGEHELIGPFHRSSHTYSYDNVRYRAHSVFFALRLDDADVSFDHLDPGEVGNIVSAAWLDPDELGHLPLSNPQLPDIARRAVAATVAQDGRGT